MPFLKTDAQTIEFHVEAKPDAEETVTYTVHYSW
jgi:pentose-5-phosphate-3-epimerase